MKYKQGRLPLIALENQYTYLNSETRNNNKLEQFMIELANMKKTKNKKKLPLIDEKYVNTARRFENKLTEIEKVMENRKLTKSQRTYSTPYPYQNVSSYYVSQGYPNYYPYYWMPSLPTTQQTPINSIEKQKQDINKQQKSKKQQKKEQPVQQTTPKNIKQIIKISDKYKINKFRVAGYVVYFSIFFKYYSRKFTQIRKNWFNQRYAINDGKIIYEGSAKILKHLQEIDLFKMISIARQKAKDFNFDENKNQKSKGSNQILPLTHFISLLLEYVSEYMTNQKFIQQHHQVFTVGILNQNFMVNNLYLPQEAALLHIHPKGYIQIEEETQIILLMLKIIVKILVFNYLLGLRYSRSWNTKQEKSYGLTDEDIQNIWNMARIAAIFLCITCQQIYFKAFPKIQGSQQVLNFNQYSPKLNIFPSKSLQELKQSKLMNEKDTQSIFIINLNGYSQIKTIMEQNQVLKKFKDKIGIKIINFLTSIYTALKIQEMKVYRFVWLTTLDEKYLIFRGKKEDIENKKKRKKLKNRNKNAVCFESNLEQINQDDEQSRQGTVGQFDENNDQGSDRDEKNQGGKGRKRKKMRFKHEQQFYDHKFAGYDKLMKLKQQKGKK